MKVLHRIFSILLIAGMMLGWTSSGSILAQSTEPAKPQVSAIDKFDAQALKDLDAGDADFFVVMTEQADLSNADRLQTKEEKGQFVFETLVATADRTQSALQALLDSQGVEYRSYYIFNAILVKSGSYNLAMTIAERSDVAEIRADYQYKVDEPINPKASIDNANAIEPNITFINADDVWGLGITGQNTVVAGNDTGLLATHPAIARHYRGCLNPPTCSSWDHNYNWYDAWSPSNVVPWDDYGHGTHTTGTMVGDDGATNQIGVAPGAQTIHCKNMVGGNGDSEHFILCFEWDLAPWDLTGQNPRPDLAPDSVNNSWGMPGGGDDSMRQAVLNLQAGGVVAEFSAGNEGNSCQSLRSPGDYWQVLTTGSVQHQAAYPGTITGFSSRGPSDLDPTPPNYFPDIMAPGENIRSAVLGNQYESWSGTSMSGPHVTALVGLIWSANPSLRGQVDQTIAIIRDTAVPLTGQNGSNCGGDYTTGPNNDWGFGTIDALAAVQYAIAMGGAGGLDGTVTDSSTGDPIENVEIHAAHEGGFAWDDLTDATGYYTMTVAAGLFDITATKFGYVTGVANGVEVITDTLTTQNFALVPAASYTVSGYVTDAATGDPLAAQVEFLDAPVAPVNTDPATGFYSVDILEGTWTMKATADLHAPQTVTVNVTGDTTQNFALSPFCDVLADDVENGNIGWTAQAPWAITTEASHSPTHSWTDSPGGSYQNYVNTSLTSPLIDLTDYSGMKINFWHTYATESGYDYAIVEFSTNGGSSWTPVESYDGSSPAWTQVELLIPQLDGQANAKIRFHFTADVSITYDGWHVDDIALIGGGPGCIPDLPIEGLTATSTSPDALGEPTTLTASVTGGTNIVYTWAFGDGDTGDGAVLDHVYPAVGTYEATVIAANSTYSDTATTTVVIEQGVTGLIATNDSPTPVGGVTTFTASVTGGENVVYTWDFGDGAIGTGQVATHVYTAKGSYTATVTATNPVSSAEAETIAVIEGYTFFIPFVAK